MAAERLAGLLSCQLRAHPGVNAALELGFCSGRQDGVASRRTVVGFARLYENVASARRLGEEATQRNGGARGRRDRVPGKRVQRGNEPATEIFDFGESVRLSSPVL